MKRVIEMVKNFKNKVYVVINKSDLNTRLSDRIEKWCHEKNIPVAGKIAFDESVVHAMLQCKSITEWLPDSEICKEIRRVYRAVISS